MTAEDKINRARNRSGLPEVENEEENEDEKGVAEDVLETVKEGVYGVPTGDPEAPYKERPGFADALKEMGEKLGESLSIMARKRVRINGQPLESDLPPVITQGRILIPVRAVSTALGADVHWNADEQEITITRDDEVTIIILIGEEEISVNGTIQEMDVSAQILVDRAYVPLRFAATALGDSVIWDSEAQEALINRINRNGNGEE